MDPAAAVAVAAAVLAQAAVSIYYAHRLTRVVQEMASRIQHPELVSHKAALDYEAPAPVERDNADLFLAGRIFNGDEPDTAAPEAPDPRVS